MYPPCLKDFHSTWAILFIGVGPQILSSRFGSGKSYVQLDGYFLGRLPGSKTPMESGRDT